MSGIISSVCPCSNLFLHADIVNTSFTQIRVHLVHFSMWNTFLVAKVFQCSFKRDTSENTSGVFIFCS